MRFRSLKPKDVPILEQLARDSGFPYPDLSHPHVEAIVVVVDSSDKPVMACAAKRLVELYLYVDPSCHPAVKSDALKLLHQGMVTVLREIGYNSVEAFLPESVSARFGRRLERTFGWVKNWASWTIRF